MENLRNMLYKLKNLKMKRRAEDRGKADDQANNEANGNDDNDDPRLQEFEKTRLYVEDKGDPSKIQSAEQIA